MVGAAFRLDRCFDSLSDFRSGAAGCTAEHTVRGVVQAAAGGLDVGLRPAGSLGVLVKHQRIQAGQAGAGRQEDCQQEKRLDPAKSRSPKERRAVHGLEYTQGRSTAVVRRTGPSAGSRNQNAAPFP